jgi:hypothetical protein
MIVVYAPELWNTVASCLIGISDIVAAVLYIDQANQSELSSIDIPLLQHIVGSADEISFGDMIVYTGVLS